MILRRAACWVETPRGLLCLFALGLAIRLVLARISEGLWDDVTSFRVWSDRLVQHGPAGFYRPTIQYVVDYPPGYLYILLALGKLWRAVVGGPPSIAVLKLPAIVADLGVGVLAMLLASRITPAHTKRRVPIRALAAAAILFNPGLVVVSAVWGQVDSVLALLVLASVYALVGPATLGREACAVALLAVATATKPQAVFALPVVAVVLIGRHASDGWSLPLRVGFLAALAAAVVVAMFSPFGLGPTQIPGFFRNAGALYQFTSLWAFNAWGAAGFYRHDVGPEALTIGGIAAFDIGLAAFAGTTIAIVVRGWRSLADRVDAYAVVLFGTAAVTCAAFALLTRIHERYLYLAVAALAPFVGDRRFRWALAILSVCFFINVHFVYVFYSHHSYPPGGAWTIQPLYDALFGFSQDALQRKGLSAITTAACLAVASFGWRWLDRSAETSGSARTVAEGFGSEMSDVRPVWDRS